MGLDRYSRQVVFPEIGMEGQKRLLKSHVVVLGMGALGSVSAQCLCRAGVGRITLIDRDIVEKSNLQRQVLYTEEDALQKIPKALAARQYLSKVNSEIVLEAVVADVDGGNIRQMTAGADLILDASDNVETRFLINELCYQQKIPWIYGGVLGSSGMTMNILPGEGPCIRCLIPAAPKPGSYPTCSTAGVLNMTSAVIASIQAAEAVKILLNSPDIRRTLTVIDLWVNDLQQIEIPRAKDCSLCVHERYEYLGKASGFKATAMCGGTSIQVAPPVPANLDLKAEADRLKNVGSVELRSYMLSFQRDGIVIQLFPDGRAMIQGAVDEKAAKSIYAEYFGI